MQPQDRRHRGLDRGATPGEVLVSSTVKDLVAGSELQLADRVNTGSKASKERGASTQSYVGMAVLCREGCVFPRA